MASSSIGRSGSRGRRSRRARIGRARSCLAGVGGGSRSPCPSPSCAASTAWVASAGATLFMTLLAAFQVLLHRHTGETDIAVGTPIANRRASELDGLIGFFVNMLVLRTDLADDPTFTGLVGRVREVALCGLRPPGLSLREAGRGDPPGTHAGAGPALPGHVHPAERAPGHPGPRGAGPRGGGGGRCAEDRGRALGGPVRPDPRPDRLGRARVGKPRVQRRSLRRGNRLALRAPVLRPPGGRGRGPRAPAVGDAAHRPRRRRLLSPTGTRPTRPSRL